jgi:hypothetical protein
LVEQRPDWNVECTSFISWYVLYVLHVMFLIASWAIVYQAVTRIIRGVRKFERNVYDLCCTWIVLFEWGKLSIRCRAVLT